MGEHPAISASYGEVEILKALWDLDRQGVQAKYVADVHQAVGERRRKLGLPEPAVTTVANTIRNGVSKGVFKEMVFTDGQCRPLVRTAEVRSSLGSSRAAQKVAYEPAVEPAQVLPQMLRELASLFPDESRMAAVIDFLKALGYPEEIIRKVEAILKKEERR